MHYGVWLLELSAHGVKLFCLGFLFRWVSMTAQSFLSAIEKPALATILSVSIALVFPVLCLGALWGLGLDGIWLNMTGTSILAAILSVILLIRVRNDLRTHETS